MFIFGGNPSVPPKKQLELYKFTNNMEYRLYIYIYILKEFYFINASMKQSNNNLWKEKKKLPFTMTPKAQQGL